LHSNFVFEKVLVNQVGWAGVNLGRIDYFFTKSEKKRLNFQSRSASFVEIK